MSLVALLNQWPFSASDWLVVELGVALAYIVFGVAGFGTALVAGPILILFMPLSKIVPLLVLLDFVAAFGNLLPSRRDVAVAALHGGGLYAGRGVPAQSQVRHPAVADGPVHQRLCPL